jgi:hypothetical protein
MIWALVELPASKGGRVRHQCTDGSQNTERDHWFCCCSGHRCNEDSLKEKREGAFPPFLAVTTVNLQQLFRLLKASESEEPKKGAVYTPADRRREVRQLQHKQASASPAVRHALQGRAESMIAESRMSTHVDTLRSFGLH